MFSPPRMLVCLVLTLALMALSLFLQQAAPGSLLAVTLYKAHLMALGGWGGYWLDRGLFPYDRPHTYLLDDLPKIDDGGPYNETGLIAGTLVSTGDFGSSMLRRAIIVAACLICVGLGA